MPEPLSPEALAFLPVFAEFVELLKTADVEAIRRATAEHQAAAQEAAEAKRAADESLSAAETRHVFADQRNADLEAEEKRVRGKDDQLTALIAENEQKGRDVDELRARLAAQAEEERERLLLDRAAHEEKVETELAALKSRERAVSVREEAVARGFEECKKLKADLDERAAQFRRLAG